MTPALPTAAFLGWAPIGVHARWPESPLEWALGLGALAATAWVLWLCVKWTVRPGEDEPDHVKRSILDDDAVPPPRPPRP